MNLRAPGNVRGMRVLLAGATGAIGRYLVPQLLEAKHEVIGITRVAGALAKYDGVREIVADVLDRDAFLDAIDDVKADAIIHQLTSLSRTPATFRDMRMTNRLRAEGTSTLIAAAKRIGAKKFVAASFFGGYGFLDLGDETVDEHSPFGEPDGRSDAVLRALLSLEQQVHAFGGVTLRYGLFYDSVASTTGPISRTWNGVLPMLHLSDAAHAAVLALAKGKPGTAYNVADSNPISYRTREFERAAAAGLKPPAQYPDGVLRVAAPFGSLLLTRQSIRMSSDKAAAELGWAPEFASLTDGLTRVPSREALIPLASSTPPPPVAEESPVAEPVEAPEPEHAEPEPEHAEPEHAEPEPPEAEPVEAPEPEAAQPEAEPEPEAAEPEDSEPEPPVAEPEPEPQADEPVEAPESEDSTSNDPDDSTDPFGDVDAAIARIGTRRD